MEEEESPPNMETIEEKILLFDEDEVPQSIQSKELDQSNDESSIPIQKRDGQKPQITSAWTIVDGDESTKGEASVLEEGLFESGGKGGEHVVVDIMEDNFEEKCPDFDGSLVDKQLKEELQQSAGEDGNVSSSVETLAENDKKVLPLAKGLDERGHAKTLVFDEVKQENIEEKLLDFDGAHQNEHQKEGLPLSDEKEAKISSPEGGSGDNGGEARAHAVDRVTQESVNEKLLHFDGTCLNEHLKEELSQSDKKEETVSSFEEALVEKDKKMSSLDGLREKGAEAQVLDEVKDEKVSSWQNELVGKEEKASSLKQEEDEPSMSIVDGQTEGEEELNEEGPGSVEGGVKVYPLQEALIEKNEKVSPGEEGLVQREGEAIDNVDETMQENVEEKLSEFDEKSVEKNGKFSQQQGESVKKDKEGSDEKEDTEEMDIDGGGPSMAAGRRTSMKRKSGRPQVSQPRRIRAPSKPKEDESLCFICFDGGDLVVCDHRSCPKVYHPSCVNRDEEYFKAKGQWICGWHICSNCQKSARYMCYTCTYSLCKGCLKGTDFACVRENKGFCQDCMKTVMLIETNKRADETVGVVDFDDKTSWLSLFKDYWVDLNAKLSLTMEELTSARNPLKEANVTSSGEETLNNTREPLETLGGAHDNYGGSSSSIPKRHKENTSAMKKLKKRSRNTSNTELQGAQVPRTSISRNIEWASKELLKFLAHMRDGDKSVLSHFDVQALLLQYIKQNNLRHPHRKSQINCDSRLLTLFGKSHVGHNEMRKLLEPHILLKEASPLATDDNQGGVVDPDPSQMDVEGNSDASTKTTLETRRKSRRRVECRLTSLDEYAAIDVHNISLLYLRRNMIENLLDDIDMFNENVVGAFVRIRISCSDSNKDMYRLVQVVGTGKAAEKYKTAKKTTDITLEILNLNKREIITIDLASNQEFTEEECKRLRQSVKCGFIDRLTVAQVQEKARGLQAVRVTDWIESEKLRLGHLRDRASEKGRIKEHRECAEKLQLLSTPDEHIRRLNEVPDIHVDSKMDPDYESTEDEEVLNSERQDKNKMLKYSFRDGDDFSTTRVGSAARIDSDVACDSNRCAPEAGVQGVVSPTVPPVRTDALSRIQGHDACEVSSPKTPKANVNVNGSNYGILKNSQPLIEPGQISGIQPQTAPQSPSTNSVSLSNLSEADKMWHYQDPAGKIQGPFSMTRLRKWSASGFFPTNLRIWRTSEKQQESILLTDAVSGKFLKDQQKQVPQHRDTNQPTNMAAAMMDSRVDNLGGGAGGNNISHPTQPSSSSTTIRGMVGPTDGRHATSSTGCESSKNYNALSGQSQVHNCARPVTPFQPSSSSTTIRGMVGPTDGRRATSSTGCESSKNVNTFSGQSQVHNRARPVTPFSRNSRQQPSLEGRDGRGGNCGRWSRGQGYQHNWNSNRPRWFPPNGRSYGRQHPYRSSSGQRFSGEQLKVQQPVNLPTHSLQPGSIDWASLQGAINRIIPSPSSCNLTSTRNSVGGSSSSTLINVNPAETRENTGALKNLRQQNKPLESPAAVTSGNHAVYSGSSTTQIVDGSNIKQCSEINSSSITPYSNQASTGVLNSECMQPANPHMNVAGRHTVSSNNDAAKMPTEAQETQDSESKRIPVSGMALVSSVASNPNGSSNLPDASASTSIAQLESQCLAPISAQEQGTNSLNVNPAQPLNMVYPTMPGATNMGWGMVAHGPMNINWCAPANMNMGWGQPAHAIMNANLGWAIPAQGMAMQASSAVNPGWVAPVIGNANPNPGWVAPPTIGNANQSAAWGAMVPGTGQQSMNDASNQNAGDGRIITSSTRRAESRSLQIP